jgi:Rap1a immunity proteins
MREDAEARYKSLIRGLVISLFVAALAPTSLAATEKKDDVQELYKMCKVRAGVSAAPPDAVVCIGFLSGVAEMMIANGELAKTLVDDRDRRSVLKFSACTKKASFGEMLQVFLKWAQKHPEMWNEPRSVGAMEAFSEKWPCP